MKNKEDNILIISNEKVYEDKGGYYCDNADIKTIIEGLDNLHSINIICRRSNKRRSLKINHRKIYLVKGPISFLNNLYKAIKDKSSKCLLISLTPFTFLYFLFLLILRKNIFLYLRSDGYEEYKAILGSKWTWIYHIMFTLVLKKSHIIVCQERLAKGKKHVLVNPSEIDENWFKDHKKATLDKIKLLYVGRISVEKGIFSLLEIFGKINNNSQLTIVGKGKTLPLANNIKYYDYQSDFKSLIKFYDENNITVLPSYTEAYPKVIDESLARLRPVIIFEDIEHVIQGRLGIFVSKRESVSLLNTIEYVLNNYSNIQDQIKKNKLPTKKEFISGISNILTKK